MKTLLAFARANAWLAILVLALAVALYQLVDPAPPRELTIATGGKDGRYYELGKLLQSELEKEGIAVNVISTAGSSENLDLLADPDGPVSVAFVQSGMERIFELGGRTLGGLGSLYYEPIWVFVRSDDNPRLLSSFRGRAVAVGPPGSGTRAVALYLLAQNGLRAEQGSVEIVEKGGHEAVELLRRGQVEAAFFTVSAQSEIIRELIAIEGIELMDIRRSAAYTARFPSLSSARISEGLLDLERNIPDSDRTTLASTATLVVNERFHPALTPLIMEVFAKRLKAGGILEKPDEFPSPRHLGFPLTREANHYFEYGPPFLMRYLPFWAASLVDRLIIFVIPLLVVLIPLSKVAGPTYRWRIRSRIYRWYRDLLVVDRKIAQGAIEDPAEERRKLVGLADELSTIDVPLSYADELYLLKQHVEYIDRRLASVEREEERET